MQEHDPTGPHPIRPAERPHRLDERVRPRITVQVVDGKICCELEPGAPPGAPDRKP